MTASTLAAALSAAHPADDETLLLRALILPDERGSVAWTEFKRIHADLGELFRTDRGELRRLSPLLARNLKTNNADVDARLWTVLRMASMREGLRADIYKQVLREAVSAISECALPFAIIRGAAVGAFVYPEVAARHSHDIDVLLRDSDVQRVADALLAAGFAPEPDPPIEAGQEYVRSFLHKTSLPVRLHTSVFEFTGYSLDTSELLASASEENLEGVRAPVLPTEVMLLQAIVHASYAPTRHTLQWVADAVKLADRVSNWPAFVRLAQDSRAAVVVYSMLSYVQQAIHETIPASVMAELRALAADASEFERDLALYGARLGARKGVSALFDATPSVINRALLAKWLALPSAEYLEWSRASRGLAGAGDSTGGRGAQLMRRLTRYIRAKNSDA